jgi:hypothetical protein
MVLVRAIEPMVAVRPGGEKANGGKFTQFVLNGAESQPTHVGKLADVALLLWQLKKQLQQLRPHFWKQNIQNRAFRLGHGKVF